MWWFGEDDDDDDDDDDDEEEEEGQEEHDNHSKVTFFAMVSGVLLELVLKNTVEWLVAIVSLVERRPRLRKNADHLQAVRLNWVGLQVCNVLYMCNMYVYIHVYLYISCIHVHITYATYVCDMCLWSYAMYKLKKNTKPERIGFVAPEIPPNPLAASLFFLSQDSNVH